MRSGDWARLLASELLAAAPGRLAHSEGVGRRAEEVRGCLPAELHDDFIAAAFLHDIGYSAAVARTGFHPVDGASYLAERGHASVACLVAYHSGSEAEAEIRGLRPLLRRFQTPERRAMDALTYCDLTTGAWGESVMLEDRLHSIRKRYRSEEPVRMAVDRAEPDLRAAVVRTRARLEGH